MNTLIKAFGEVVGLVSTAFMFFVFFSEILFQRGVLYYENNMWIAGMEFLITGLGVLVLAKMLIERTEPIKAQSEEVPFGHGKDRGAYS